MISNKTFSALFSFSLCVYRIGPERFRFKGRIETKSKLSSINKNAGRKNVNHEKMSTFFRLDGSLGNGYYNYLDVSYISRETCNEFRNVDGWPRIVVIFISLTRAFVLRQRLRVFGCRIPTHRHTHNRFFFVNHVWMWTCAYVACSWFAFVQASSVIFYKSKNRT